MAHSESPIQQLRNPEPIPPRPSVERFGRAMELKLRANDHKRPPESWGLDDVELEAADVANFLLMIVHAVGATP